MIPKESSATQRRRTRRELFTRYVQLQNDLVESDPGSSAYQATVHAFRHLGYALIANGFEDDLDRLLRIRVIEGGRKCPRKREDRRLTPDLLVLERRLL